MHKNSSVSVTSNRLSLSISYHSTVKSNQWRIIMFGNNPSCPQWIHPVSPAVQVKYDIRDQFEYGWTIRRVWLAEGSNHGADHYLHRDPLNFSQTGTRWIVLRTGIPLAPSSVHSLSPLWMDNRTGEPGFVRAYAELCTLWLLCLLERGC